MPGYVVCRAGRVAPTQGMLRELYSDRQPSRSTKPLALCTEVVKTSGDDVVHHRLTCPGSACVACSLVRPVLRSVSPMPRFLLNDDGVGVPLVRCRERELFRKYIPLLRLLGNTPSAVSTTAPGAFQESRDVCCGGSRPVLRTQLREIGKSTMCSMPGTKARRPRVLNTVQVLNRQDFSR